MFVIFRSRTFGAWHPGRELRQKTGQKTRLGAGAVGPSVVVASKKPILDAYQGFPVSKVAKKCINGEKSSHIKKTLEYG